MELLEQYNVAVSRLAIAKRAEMDLRLKVAKLFEDKSAGTRGIEIDGILVKATFKDNITVDRNALDEIIDDLSSEEIACLDFKPNIKLREFKQLEDSGLLEEALVIKPATPSIKVTILEDEA